MKLFSLNINRYSVKSIEIFSNLYIYIYKKYIY